MTEFKGPLPPNIGPKQFTEAYHFAAAWVVSVRLGFDISKDGGKEASPRELANLATVMLAGFWASPPDWDEEYECYQARQGFDLSVLINELRSLAKKGEDDLRWNREYRSLVSALHRLGFTDANMEPENWSSDTWDTANTLTEGTGQLVGRYWTTIEIMVEEYLERRGNFDLQEWNERIRDMLATVDDVMSDFLPNADDATADDEPGEVSA